MVNDMHTRRRRSELVASEIMLHDSVFCVMSCVGSLEVWPYNQHLLDVRFGRNIYLLMHRFVFNPLIIGTLKLHSN